MMLHMAPHTRQMHAQHGPAIRALRQKDGYTVQDLANLVGVSYSHLQNIEHENKAASLEHLNKIARILGVSLAAVSREIDPAAEAVSA